MSTERPARPGTGALLWCALGLASTVVFFQGLRLFAINYVYFNVSLAHMAGWLVIATLLLVLAVVGPVAALRLRRSEIYSAIILGAAYFAWFKASFLRWDYGIFAGLGIDWSKHVTEAKVDIGAFTFILSLAILARRVLLPRAGILIAYLFVAQSISLVLSTPLANHSGREAILAKQTVRLLPRGSEKLSRTSNVIILVLDTLQSDVFTELVRQNPQRQATLRGFTFFRDTASSSALTSLSVPNALTGSLFDNQTPYGRYLQSVYETPGSALKNLREAGYWVELVPWGQATPIPLEATFISNIAEPSFEPNLPALEAILATATFSVMPQFLQRRIYPYVDAITIDFFDPGSGSNLKFLRGIEQLPVELIDQPVAKLIHLRGPHIPLLTYGQHGFDYSSAALAETVDPVIVPYTRYNYTRVTEAMLAGVTRYLSKIQRAGVYDASVIFIFGDHGAGRLGLRFRAPNGWPATEPRDVISSHLQSGAAATLLVKTPGVTRAFQTSDTPVALSDIACTLNTFIGRRPDSGCLSLFAPQRTSARGRVFVDVLNARLDAHGYLPPMTEYAIDAPMWRFSSWHRTGRTLLGGRIRTDSFEPYEFGTRIRFGEGTNADMYLHLGWRARDDNMTGIGIDGLSAVLTLPLRATPPGDLMLDLEMSNDSATQRSRTHRVVVSVNDTKVDEIEVSTSERHSIRIPKRTVVNNKLNIRLDLAETSAPAGIRIVALTLEPAQS